jgi:tripartite-type tricarboxylate transporter receptor subunit TctC
MLRRIVSGLFGCAILLGLFAPCPVARAAEFPNRPIRLVIPFGPGTGSDLMGRIIGQQLSIELGQNVIIENRPGATGGVGTQYVINSQPDGYTLVFGTNATLITTPVLYPSMSYKPDTDLNPVAMVARTSMVLVTGNSASSPKTLKELVSLLNSKRSTFGSTGVGTNGDVISRIMLKDVGATATLVTYKGSGDSLIDAIRGDTAFVIDTPAAILPFVKSGMLRPLAVTGTERLQAIPDMPTFKELGVEGLANIYAWFGVLAPPKTPPEVVSVLSAKLEKVMQNPEVKSRLAAMEVDPFIMHSAEFKKFLQSEMETWGGFIRSTDMKISQ